MTRHLLLFGGLVAALAGCTGDQGDAGPAGPVGAAGGPGQGERCWDTNGNGQCAGDEDTDGSGTCTVADCRGPIGAIGPQGPAGAAGPEGPQGPQGPVGAVGPAGPAGPDGPRGFQGPIGVIGVQGVQGPQGAQGPRGPAGPRGTTIAEYELDEEAAAVAFADGSGLGNVLQSDGGVAPGSAIAHAGRSVAFSGGEGIYAPPGNLITDAARISAELWLRTSQPGGTYTLLEKNNAYRLRAVEGQVTFTVSTTGGPCSVSHPAPLQLDQWMHVSGMFDGLSVAIEIDGQRKLSSCRTGRIAPSAGSIFALGGRYNGAAWSEVFRGNLDEVRIRSSADVTVGGLAGGCAAGEAMTAIRADGTVECAQAATQRVIRYKVFDTYLEACCWAGSDDSSLFGGVNPSTWTDGSGQASFISSDAETLRTLFNNKIYPGANALVSSVRWDDQSSTNGKVTVALLRIRNTTSDFIDWTPQFYFTSYEGRSERASVSLNGQDVWNSCCGDNYMDSTAAVTMGLPPNQTSTVIFVSPSSPGWYPWPYFRFTFLAFFNGSLAMPPGLELVDDLDRVQGSLW